MTVWYIHRNPDKSIASAHGDHMPGYNDETLDDASNAEIKAWLAKVRTPPVVTPADKLAALGLTPEDLKTLVAAAKN